MSEITIAALQKRVEELTAQVTTLSAEQKSRRFKNQQLKAELGELTAQVKTLSAERDAYKVKAEAAPDELQAKIADLEAQVATRDHRDAFTQALAGLKAKGDDGKESEYGLNRGASIADLWQATGYRPEGATPDGNKAAELLGQALKAKPYLFAAKAPVETNGAAPGGAPTAIRTPASPPGPGASRSVETQSAPPASAFAQIDQQFAALGKDRPGRIA